jgi:hypothetical protein
LVQCCAGLRPGEDAADAHQRLERILDATFGGWRSRAVMDHRSTTPSPGIRDAVGRGWQHRRAIDHGDGVLLAGDWVAAPGLLAEVSFVSAVAAAERAVEQARPRAALAGDST